MITAPSEIRKATGMLPVAGGLSGATGRPAAAELVAAAPRSEEGIAARSPSAADFSRNSRRFMAKFSPFPPVLRRKLPGDSPVENLQEVRGTPGKVSRDSQRFASILWITRRNGCVSIFITPSN